MIAESEVQSVWHLQGPHFLVRYKCLSSIETQQFSCHSDGVQGYEECVPANQHIFHHLLAGDKVVHTVEMLLIQFQLFNN